LYYNTRDQYQKSYKATNGDEITSIFMAMDIERDGYGDGDGGG
jgi:hypothetical protein